MYWIYSSIQDHPSQDGPQIVKKHFKAHGHLDPLADTSGHRSSTIEGILRECQRWESLKDKREPLTWEMVNHQQALARQYG